MPENQVARALSEQPLEPFNGFLNTLVVFLLPMIWQRLLSELADDTLRYYYGVTDYSESIKLQLPVRFFLYLIFQLRKYRWEAGNLVAVQ